MSKFKKMLLGALILGFATNDCAAVITRSQARSTAKGSQAPAQPAGQTVKLPDGRVITIVDGVVAPAPAPAQQDPAPVPAIEALKQNKACAALASFCAATALTLGMLNAEQSWAIKAAALTLAAGLYGYALDRMFN